MHIYIKIVHLFRYKKEMNMQMLFPFLCRINAEMNTPSDQSRLDWVAALCVLLPLLFFLLVIFYVRLTKQKKTRGE